MSTSSGGRPSSDDDQVLPFQLDALGVRGRLVRLSSTLDRIIERHGYPLAVARPLAEAMTLCAALATSLKYDGIFTLQISGDGPIRLLVTDLTSDGALRGYIGAVTDVTIGIDTELIVLPMIAGTFLRSTNWRD